jgi:hypothetical protein
MPNPSNFEGIKLSLLQRLDNLKTAGGVNVKNLY